MKLHRDYYKPFDFGWAYDIWKVHESMHWLPSAVSLSEDVRDWNSKLNPQEKDLVTKLFRFFTQADVGVAKGYTQKFLPVFGGIPELAMMMSSFAARESIHVDFYSTLLETLGMPETTYKEFMQYKEMRDKNDYVERFGTSSPLSILKSLAVYAAFTEGLQLFGSFIILLNFSRFNKLKNMGNGIAWSIRDEDCHVQGMTKLFREYAKDYYQTDKHPALEHELLPIAFKMVQMEEAFIDLIFKGNEKGIEGLTAKQVKDYIHWLANQRWLQLGFNTHLFTIVDNPLTWVNHMVYGAEHANFFEQRSTSYSKGLTRGTLEDIQW